MIPGLAMGQPSQHKARIEWKTNHQNRKLAVMTDYERVEKVILHIRSHYQEQPNLSRLAKVAQCSESHFHRLFSRWAGVTPKAFLKFLTLEHAKQLLRQSKLMLKRETE